MYKQLNHYEREQIGLLKAKRVKVVDIAIQLGRHPSTIRRELRRLGPRTQYSPLLAQKDAKKKRRIPRTEKKLLNESLRLLCKRNYDVSGLLNRLHSI